ncbi:hypothetical protein PF008_g4829 [Phytophthora fragariae]|uniref:Uncharacterized protein n=1 Tax=Phytophthora fragariae TaxID=53985 RepID=A0A6G0SAR9_9STRA|nr:hypothetical protein PF008_g4829 [Phytophthora fragariae]
MGCVASKPAPPSPAPVSAPSAQATAQLPSESSTAPHNHAEHSKPPTDALLKLAMEADDQVEEVRVEQDSTILEPTYRTPCGEAPVKQLLHSPSTDQTSKPTSYHQTGKAPDRELCRCHLDRDQMWVEVRCQRFYLCSSLKSQERQVGYQVHHHEDEVDPFQMGIELLKAAVAPFPAVLYQLQAEGDDRYT